MLIYLADMRLASDRQKVGPTQRGRQRDSGQGLVPTRFRAVGGSGQAGR